MIKLLLTTIIFFEALLSYSQSVTRSLKSQMEDTSYYKYLPVLIIRRPFKGYVETTNIVLNMLDVDSTKSFDEKTPGIYGEKAKSGLWEYNIINSAPLVNFDEFSAIYNLSPSDQNLPIFIDSVYAHKPKQTYFELGDIISVTISTEKSTGMKFVNIITLFPPFKNGSPF